MNEILIIWISLFLRSSLNSHSFVGNCKVNTVLCHIHCTVLYCAHWTVLCTLYTVYTATVLCTLQLYCVHCTVHCTLYCILYCTLYRTILSTLYCTEYTVVAHQPNTIKPWAIMSSSHTPSSVRLVQSIHDQLRGVARIFLGRGKNQVRRA